MQCALWKGPGLGVPKFIFHEICFPLQILFCSVLRLHNQDVGDDQPLMIGRIKHTAWSQATESRAPKCASILVSALVLVAVSRASPPGTNDSAPAYGVMRQLNAAGNDQLNRTQVTS